MKRLIVLPVLLISMLCFAQPKENDNEFTKLCYQHQDYSRQMANYGDQYVRDIHVLDSIIELGLKTPRPDFDQIHIIKLIDMDKRAFLHVMRMDREVLKKIEALDYIYTDERGGNL